MTGQAPASRTGADTLARFGLGTVQFGRPYGISNTTGQVHPDEVAKILRLAANLGVRWLDTAADYGDAEALLGTVLVEGPFRTVTKTMPLRNGSIESVIEGVRKSMRLLRRKPLDALLVHSAADLRAAEGPALWRSLLALKSSGEVHKLGISVYCNDGPLDLARQFAPDLMQVPISLLDQRLIASGELARIKELGVEIHARSIFNQGLMFLQADQVPPRLAHGAPRLAEIKHIIATIGISPLQAALAFALQQPAIDLIVVGVTSARELNEIAMATQVTPQTNLDWRALALEDAIMLDPRSW
jgi:aryl-alcohol dehydrogenase-like predicted oxidoreductase